MYTLEQVRKAFPDGRSENGGWLTHCPIPSHGQGHGDRNPSLIITPGNKLVVKCRANCDQAEVFKTVIARLPNGRSAAQTTSSPEQHKPSGFEYTLAQLEKTEANLPAAEAFLASRGITLETARRLRFGFDTIGGKGYIVMPTFVSGDLAAVKLRAIGPTSRDKKWMKWSRDDKTFWLFNRDTVAAAGLFEDVWITESELDAAMLESMGKRAVSVDSSNHRLTDDDIALLKASACSLVFAPDADAPGVKCALRLAEDLGLENAISVKPKTKDLGDLYKSESASFAAKLDELRENVSPLWRASFRSGDELDTGEVRQLITNILPEGNTFTGACSGVGKTWWQLSMAKALTTGRPFLGVHAVPERQKVLYLIPEAGDRPFRKRLLTMGIPMDGSVFLCRTLKDGLLKLDDPSLAQAIRDWKPVIFLDTAIRFAGFKDENSAAENAGGLASSIFELQRLGAISVVSAHHSPKSTANVNKHNKYESEMSLENMLRGSGDIGAMCDTVWALRHDDGGKDAPEDYLEDSKNVLTRIYVANVKPRDFQPADPFVIQGRPHIDERGDFVVITQAPSLGDNREMGKKAAKLVASNPNLSKAKLAAHLGVDKRTLQEILAPEGWQWDAKSATSGSWKRIADDQQERFL
jgi:AAA domain-containing protein/Toprim domain-containing protein